MTEKDLEIQRLRYDLNAAQIENKRLREKLKSALWDISAILADHSLCGYCMYCDADCSPHGGNCVPKWRGL